MSVAGLAITMKHPFVLVSHPAEILFSVSEDGVANSSAWFHTSKLFTELRSKSLYFRVISNTEHKVMRFVFSHLFHYYNRPC